MTPAQLTESARQAAQHDHAHNFPPVPSRDIHLQSIYRNKTLNELDLQQWGADYIAARVELAKGER